MRFQVLGPLEAWEGGRRLALGGPKQRLVLAHLLLRANQVVPADRLIDQVWGEDPPDAARSALQAYVSRLRRSLGPGRLQGRPPGYVLGAAPDEVDVLRFEGLVREARRRAAAEPWRRCAYWTTRWPCGGARRWPTSRQSRRWGPSSPGWRSCGWRPARNGSTRF